MGLERLSIFKNLPPRGLKTRALLTDVCQHEERLPTIAYRTSICKPFKPSLSRQKFHKYFDYFTTPKHRHRRVLIERMGATKPGAGLLFRLAVSLWNLCSLCLRCLSSPTTPPPPPTPGLLRKLSLLPESCQCPLEGLGWDGGVGVDGRIHRVKMGPPGVCWQMLFNLFQPQLTDVVMPIISIPDSTQAMLI